MKLRPYQTATVEAIWNYFQESAGNPLVALPTGTGKSVIIAEFLRQAFSAWEDQRVLVLTHVKELLSQNLEKLLTLWPTAPAGVYSAGLGRRDLASKILFCGIASIAKHAETLGKIDLVLIDECHLVSHREETQYQTLLGALVAANPLLKVIGFTATPYRLGLGHLTEGGIFTDVCYDLTGREAFNQLVREGYLAPLITKKATHELDVSSVAIRGGEYAQKELQECVDKETVTIAAVQELLYYGEDRQHWLLFASGVEHAQHIAEILGRFGVSTGVVHASCPSEERASILARFKSGELRAVVNNNLLTTGFDFPAIDLIGILRPTKSPGLWVQMLGRGTRPCEGKLNCLVLDFAGNTRTLGPINDPVLPQKKGTKGGGTAPVRLCEKCGTYQHASVRICEACGHEFPREHRLATTAYADAVMAPSMPEVQRFPVTNVSYSAHRKPGRPASLQVSYYCGLRLFREWVCLEHTGFPRRKATLWWQERTDTPPPETVEAAAQMASGLRVPRHIGVRLDTKYPEVVSHEF